MNRDIFKKRVNLKPYEYPELLEYKDSMRHSYWISEEFNYTADIQDFKTNINEVEKSAITRAMLAISQIEVSVKRFWSDIYHYMPKPEVDMVGVTFGESEARHLDAYANLLELLGLNEMFEKLHEYKPLMARVEYMEKFMRGKNEGEKGFILSMILFSLFVEHISLFSQFVLIMSFNKHRNLFKGMSNAIEATSKEEELHGKFGIALYNIVKEEHPEIFTAEFYQELHQLASDAFTAEMDIIDWIYERGDIPFISKNTIINYIKHRYNNSFVSLGQERIYDVDETLLKEVSWFDEELISTKEVDFFNKRSIDYSKRGKAITADDLF